MTVTSTMLTITRAMKEIRDLGMTARYRDGEWRVNFPKGTEATACYESDAQAAVDTARAMKQRG